MIARPGFYELVCDPGPAGLMLATMITERADYPLWIVSVPMADDVKSVWGDLSRYPGHAVDRVGVAFWAIKEAGSFYDLIVLCDLASLLPDHSASRHIARSVRRAVSGWTPACPVLVLNQYRHPAPPGGIFWRQVGVSRLLQTLYNDWGFTLAHLEGSRCFVVKYPTYKVEYRPLYRVEQYLVEGVELAEGIDNRWIM